MTAVSIQNPIRFTHPTETKTIAPAQQQAIQNALRLCTVLPSILLAQYTEQVILAQYSVHVWCNAMKVINFSEARNHLKRVLDEVVNDSTYTVISRRDAEDAVVMSLEHFNGLMETVHLLRSPANSAHLNKSIKQYQSGKTKERGLLDE